MIDLIERQSAIDAVRQFYDEYIAYDNGKSIEELIADLPSVQERKKGHWIEVNDDEDITINGKCSVCGWESHLYADDVAGMPYCPKCGASMTEGAK